jgi:uncharacterized repeat protein (TIGR01451 family)
MGDIRQDDREPEEPERPSRQRRRARSLLAGIVAAVAMAVAAPVASAAPWQCDAFGYLFQAPTGTPPGLVQQIDLATGDYTTLGQTPTDVLNAVGYNQLDDFFYAWNSTTGAMVQVHDDLSLTPVPSGAFPGGVVGDFDEDGHYWALGSDSLIYEIDYVPGSPTYGQVLGTVPIGPAPPGVASGGADWAWIDGFLYMIGNDAGDRSHLLRINPTTGARADLTPGGFGFSNTGVGAVYADARGYLYGSDNATGGLVRVDPVTLQWIRLPTATSASSNDGARCASAPIPTVLVRKVVDGRVRAADEFTVGLADPRGRAATSASTSGGAATAETADWPATQNGTYRITDAMAGASPTPIGEYVRSIACVDGAGTPVPTGGSTGSWTLAIANATDYRCTVTNRAQADLELRKTASPSPAVPGTDETYTLRVTNRGPSTAVNPTVRDRLPDGLTFVSAGAGCGFAAGTVTCTTAEIAPGASHTFTMTARVASSVTSCEQIRNSATVTSDAADPDPSNNSDDVCPGLRGRSDLSIAKTPAASTVVAGGQIMYTLVVRNAGPSDATHVRVEDRPGNGLTLVSAQPGQGTCSTAGGTAVCDLGRLEAGGSTQVLVTATAPAAANVCPANAATVEADQHDPEATDNSATASVCTVPGPAARFDLVVTKTAASRSVVVGQPLRYRIVVANRGPDAAPDVSVTDTFNARGALGSVRTTQGTCVRRMPVRCQLGTVAAGASVTITVVLRPATVGSARTNTASAAGRGDDGNPRDNIAGAVAAVRRVPLKVAKRASRTSVRAGTAFSYVIRVWNPSRGVARDVRVCDRLPSGVVLVKATPRARVTNGRHCWTVRTLGAGKSRRFLLRVRAIRGAAGRKVNTVVATSPNSRTARARRAIQVRGGTVAAGGVTG